MTTGRAFYIDHLRILLTMLVILHHTAIAYGALGGWYYVTPETVQGGVLLGLSAMLAVNQAFFMSFFFFISAYLMPASYDKKGFSKFLKDRLVRLGIPLLGYILIIHPNLNYIIQLHIHADPGPWAQFMWRCITQFPGSGPLWFVLTLLVFEILYAMYRRFIRTSCDAPGDRLPSQGKIVLFILFCGILAFGVRLFYPTGKAFFGLQFGYFVLYIAMYLMGIIAFRKQWPERFPLRKMKFWFYLALWMIPMIVISMALNIESGQISQFMGGLNGRALLYALWEPFICVGFCGYLFLAFKKYFNKKSDVLMVLSADSYTVYIIHPVLVTGFTFLFESAQMSPWMKFAATLLLAVFACYLLAHWIRKIPGLKNIL